MTEIIQYEYQPWLTHHGDPQAKWNMSLQYTWKETAENGMLLKEYCCMHVSQVNYSKPSDCNKIIGYKFNESFHF